MGDGSLSQEEIDALEKGADTLTQDEIDRYMVNADTASPENNVVEQILTEIQPPENQKQAEAAEISGSPLNYWEVRALCNQHNLFENRGRSKRVAKQYVTTLTDETREKLENAAKQHGVRFKKFVLREILKILHQAIDEYENLVKVIDLVHLPLVFRSAETSMTAQKKPTEGELFLHSQKLFSAMQTGNEIKLTHRFDNNLKTLKLRFTAEVARTYLPMREIQKLSEGDVVCLNKFAGEVSSLFAEKQKVADGEMVVIDGYYGIRVTDIASNSSIVNTDDALSVVFDEPYSVVRLILDTDYRSVNEISELTEGSLIQFARKVDTPWRLEIGADELNPEKIYLGELLIRNEEICFEILKVHGSKLKPKKNKRDASHKKNLINKSNTFEKNLSTKPILKDEITAIVMKVPQQILLNFLRQEYPQTVALVLSLGEPFWGAEILNQLPDNLQPEIILRLARGVTVPDWVLAELTDELQLLATADNLVETGGGVKPAAEIVVMSGRSSEKYIIEFLENEDPELAEEIKNNLLVFEDLVLLTDKDIQKVLREIDNQVLALCLRGANDTEVQEKIFRNMSQRAVKLLREDMDFMGPVRLSDIHNAQQTFVQIMRQLEESGDIVIARFGDSEPLVFD